MTRRSPGQTLSLPATESLTALLACCAVGVFSGIAAGYLRLHLGMPGHKVLVWMTPIIIARLLSRSPAGMTAGAFSSAMAAVLVGGHFAGAAMHLPMVALGGAVFDAGAGFCERRGLSARWAIPLLGFAAAGANLVLLAKRLLTPLFHSRRFLGISGIEARVVSYAFFGLLAGLAGATAATLLRRRWR
ncbi:MAG: hypothetical protein QGD94_09380, partial [Planctomycetia bacterium]|nr:hypothetical protein [Planctomycetia bacterium]